VSLWSQVQNNNVGSQGSSPAPITFSSVVQEKGDVNVVYAQLTGSGGTATVTGVTDTYGNTYAQAVALNDATNGLYTTIWVAYNIKATTLATPNVVHVAFSGGTAYAAIQELQWGDGAITVNPVVSGTTGTGSKTTGGASVPSCSVNVYSASDMVCAIAGSATPQTAVGTIGGNTAYLISAFGSAGPLAEYYTSALSGATTVTSGTSVATWDIVAVGLSAIPSGYQTGIYQVGNYKLATSDGVCPSPSGTQAGDVLVAWGGFYFDDGTTSVGTPSGWTLLKQTQFASGEGDETITLCSWYIVLTAAAASTYTWAGYSPDTDASFAPNMVCFRGVNNSSPIDTTAGVTTGSGTSATPSCPGITTSFPGELVMMPWFLNDFTNTTTPNGWFQPFGTEPGFFNGTNESIFVQPVFASGTVLPTASFTILGTDDWMLHQFALVPAALPSISSQPTGVSTYTGNTATFSVTASASSGGGTLTYQWYFSGQVILGATSSSYTTPTLHPWNSGPIYVIVTEVNGIAPIESNIVQLFVFPTNADLTLWDETAVPAGWFDVEAISGVHGSITWFDEELYKSPGTAGASVTYQGLFDKHAVGQAWFDEEGDPSSRVGLWDEDFLQSPVTAAVGTVVQASPFSSAQVLLPPQTAILVGAGQAPQVAVQRTIRPPDAALLAPTVVPGTIFAGSGQAPEVAVQYRSLPPDLAILPPVTSSLQGFGVLPQIAALVYGVPPPLSALLPPQDSVYLGAGQAPEVAIQYRSVPPDAAPLPPVVAVSPGANPLVVLTAIAIVQAPTISQASLPPQDVIFAGAGSAPQAPAQYRVVPPDAGILPPASSSRQGFGIPSQVAAVVYGAPPPLTALLPPQDAVVAGSGAPSAIAVQVASPLVPPFALPPPQDAIFSGAGSPPQVAVQILGAPPPPLSPMPPLDSIYLGAGQPSQVAVQISGIPPQAAFLPPQDSIFAGAGVPSALPQQYGVLPPAAAVLPPSILLVPGANPPVVPTAGYIVQAAPFSAALLPPQDVIFAGFGSPPQVAAQYRGVPPDAAPLPPSISSRQGFGVAPQVAFVVTGLPPPFSPLLPPQDVITSGAGSPPQVAVQASPILSPPFMTLPPQDAIFMGAGASQVAIQTIGVPPPFSAILPPLDSIFAGSGIPAEVPVQYRSLPPDAALLPPTTSSRAGFGIPSEVAQQILGVPPPLLAALSPQDAVLPGANPPFVGAGSIAQAAPSSLVSLPPASITRAGAGVPSAVAAQLSSPPTFYVALPPQDVVVVVPPFVPQAAVQVVAIQPYGALLPPQDSIVAGAGVPPGVAYVSFARTAPTQDLPPQDRLAAGVPFVASTRSIAIPPYAALPPPVPVWIAGVVNVAVPSSPKTFYAAPIVEAVALPLRQIIISGAGSIVPPPQPTILFPGGSSVAVASIRASSVPVAGLGPSAAPTDLVGPRALPVTEVRPASRPVTPKSRK
jgi:hypothetical protein